jgi:hypothetical protein
MANTVGYNFSFLRADKVRDLRIAQDAISVISFIHIAGLVFFFSYVNNSILMTFNYSAFALSLPPPGPFYDVRFSFKWFIWACFGLRLLVPAAAMWMLPWYSTGSLWRKTLHLTVSRLEFLFETFIFFVMLWWWCSCNWDITPNNPCNDAKYCCVYYTVNYPDHCPNNAPCTPNVVEADLQKDPLFMFSWLSVVILWVVSILHIILNEQYIRYANSFLFTVTPGNRLAGI